MQLATARQYCHEAYICEWRFTIMITQYQKNFSEFNFLLLFFITFFFHPFLMDERLCEIRIQVGLILHLQVNVKWLMFSHRIYQAEISCAQSHCFVLQMPFLHFHLNFQPQPSALLMKIIIITHLSTMSISQIIGITRNRCASWSQSLIDH